MSQKLCKRVKMFWSKVILLTYALLAYCESVSLDAYFKGCALNDNDCEKQMYQSIIQGIAESGIPEIGIPVFSPYQIKNLGISALGIVNITLTEGVLKNIKTCQINKYQQHMETISSSLELICNSFIIEGHYKLRSNPLVENLIGGNKIHGKGKGLFTADNVKLNLEIPYDIKKLDDGELHFIINADKTTYTFEVGKLTIAADNLYVGEQEISALAVGILNENWEMVVNTVGRSVLDIAVGLFIEHANKLFVAVPAKKMISGDLSPYVKN